MTSIRAVRAAVVMSVAVLGGVRAAGADRPSAAAAMPIGGNPFLLVTTTTSTASEWDDATRRPEWAVYPDGAFLLTKSDGRLYEGRLTPDETLDLMDFLASDARLASVEMTYVVASPLTTLTRYTFATRSGTSSIRRRASGGFGTGVAEGERSLARVDQRLFAIADRADRPYAPGRLLVVSRAVGIDEHTPVWSWNDALPFAAFVDATDLATRRGGIVAEDDARIVRGALDQSPVWRFRDRAAEIQHRPALPHEMLQAPWRGAPSPRLPVPPPIVSAPPPAPARPTSVDGMNADGMDAPAPLPPPSSPTPPAPAPKGPPPTSPVPGAGPDEWRADDLDFAGVQKVFADLKKKANRAPHKEFWTKEHEAFVAFEFPLATGDGKVKLLVPGDGSGSNLVRALKGEKLKVTMADGSTREDDFGAMPPTGAPMRPEDIERVRRWVDRGAPKERPAGGGEPAAPGSPDAVSTAPQPPRPMNPPGPTPTAPTAPTVPAPSATVAARVAVSLIGADTVNLGDRAVAEDGNAPPRFFVACDAAAWDRIFAHGLPQQCGPHGGAVCKRLDVIRDAVKGYDWSGSPLILFVAPATDNYDWTIDRTLDVLSDGTGRLALTHRHEARNYIKAPEIVVRWAIYRADTRGCPRRVVVQVGERYLSPTNSE